MKSKLRKNIYVYNSHPYDSIYNNFFFYRACLKSICCKKSNLFLRFIFGNMIFIWDIQTIYEHFNMLRSYDMQIVPGQRMGKF